MTLTSTTEVMIPVDKTGLIVFDMYENARGKIESRGALEPAVTLVNECRSRGIPVFFTRPVHRSDGRDHAIAMPDMNREHEPYEPNRSGLGLSAGAPGTMPLNEFGSSPDDYDITKHRWSAFYDTALDLSLRTLGITTLLVIGGTAHIGVASTVYSARDRDYQIFVVRDACHGEKEEFEGLMNFIFPQVCHVRTLEESLKLMV